MARRAPAWAEREAVRWLAVPMLVLYATAHAKAQCEGTAAVALHRFASEAGEACASSNDVRCSVMQELAQAAEDLCTTLSTVVGELDAQLDEHKLVESYDATTAAAAEFLAADDADGNVTRRRLEAVAAAKTEPRFLSWHDTTCDANLDDPTSDHGTTLDLPENLRGACSAAVDVRNTACFARAESACLIMNTLCAFFALDVDAHRVSFFAECQHMVPESGVVLFERVRDASSIDAESKESRVHRMRRGASAPRRKQALGPLPGNGEQLIAEGDAIAEEGASENAVGAEGFVKKVCSPGKFVPGQYIPGVKVPPKPPQVIPGQVRARLVSRHPPCAIGTPIR